MGIAGDALVWISGRRVSPARVNEEGGGVWDGTSFLCAPQFFLVTPNVMFWVILCCPFILLFDFMHSHIC